MSGLTAEQVESFHQEGYLHLPDVLEPQDLDPVQAELEDIIEDAARRLMAAGSVDSDYADLPFDRRLIPLVRADASAAAGINFPANLGPAIFDFLHNDRLLDIVESIVGTEIYAHSCQHIRAKLPATGDYAGALSQSEWDDRRRGTRIWAHCCPKRTKRWWSRAGFRWWTLMRRTARCASCRAVTKSRCGAMYDRRKARAAATP